MNAMEYVCAGNICGIGGLHDCVSKTAMISTTPNVPKLKLIQSLVCLGRMPWT